MVRHHEERVRHLPGLTGEAAVAACCKNYHNSVSVSVSSSLNSVSSFNAQFQAFKKLQNLRKKYCESFEKCKKHDNSYGCLYNLHFSHHK